MQYYRRCIQRSKAMKSKQQYKKALVCILLTLIIPIRVYTQQVESERDKIFEHVDLPQVPYGILENYGLSSVSLLPYTKQELDTTNYFNYLDPASRIAWWYE